MKRIFTSKGPLLLLASLVLAAAIAFYAHRASQHQKAAREQALLLQEEVQAEWKQAGHLDRTRKTQQQLQHCAGLLKEAEALFQKRRYSDAIATYLRANVAIRLLRQTSAEEDESLKLRDAAQKARERAIVVEQASKDAPLLKQAQGLFDSAASAFQAGDLSSASRSWKESATLFSDLRQTFDEAGVARTAIEKHVKRFDRKWFDRYGSTLWRDLLEKMERARKDLQEGHFPQATQTYMEAYHQLVGAAREARRLHEQDFFKQSQGDYMNEIKKYDRAKMSGYAVEAWKAVALAEARAQEAVAMKLPGEAAYLYREAKRFLLEASVTSELHIIKQLTQTMSEQSQEASTVERKKQLKQRSEQVNIEATHLKEEKEKRRQEEESLRKMLFGAAPKTHYTGVNLELASQARKHFENQEWAAAARIYEQILESDPQNVFALSDLSSTLVNDNRMEEAERAIRAILAQNPFDAFSLSLLGMVLSRMERHDEAFEVLHLATSIFSGNPEAFHYLGICHLKQNRWKEAEASLRKAVALQPKLSEAHFNLAIVLISQTPPALALARKHYTKALELGQTPDPRLAEVLRKQAK